MEAFKEWRHYLLGTEKPVTVYTDHQNLHHFLTTNKWSGRQIRCAQTLTEFNFKIVYRPGTRGGKPDALSRWPEYRPEEGAAHSELSILKPEHFQISIVRGETEKRLETGKTEFEQRIRIKRLNDDATLLTKGSLMGA